MVKSVIPFSVIRGLLSCVLVSFSKHSLIQYQTLCQRAKYGKLADETDKMAGWDWQIDERNKSFSFILFAAWCRMYHPAPLPRCPPDIASPLLFPTSRDKRREAGELKLPSTLKEKGGAVVTLKHNGGMLCNSPASLFEGGGGKGAGGGLSIKPHYNLAYDESNKSLIFYPCIPFAAVSRIYHPAPLPRCPPDIASPLLSGEAGELKLVFHP